MSGPYVEGGLPSPTKERHGVKDLVEWFRAQLDEDERVALATPPGNWNVWLSANAPERTEQAMAEHIVRWDRTRVLADVEAKRQILAEYYLAYAQRKANPDDLAIAGRLLGAVRAVKVLAVPYAGREGYRPEWRP